MLLALVGAAIGVAAAFGLARFLETLLYQIKPTDPLAFTVAPARRAMNVDPMIAIRYE